MIINGQETTLPEKLLRLNGEEAYAAWAGYAAEGAVLHADYMLTIGASALEVNATLNMIDSIDEVLVIQTDAGVFYLSGAFANKEPVEIVVEEAPETPQSSGSSSNKGSSSYRPSSGSSGGSGGSSSGGSTSSSGSSSSGGGPSSGSGGNAGSGSADSADNTPEWSPRFCNQVSSLLPLAALSPIKTVVPCARSFRKTPAMR